MLVGEIEVVPILDAVGELGELAELYPETPASAWEPYREWYPDLFSETRWLLPCACFVIRAGETTILVDTGVGPPGLWDWDAVSEGALPGAMEALGVGRADVDVVFLTHLHVDHLGWNADREGTPFFPRARYVVHRDAVAFARTRSELSHLRRCVEPLVDRFEHVAADGELAPGVAAVPLVGHYPGHMGLRVASGDERAFLIADAAVHPALLDHPEWRYVSDGDHERCVETRVRLLDELLESDVLVACGHYPGGIGRIVRHGDKVRWEPV